MISEELEKKLIEQYEKSMMTFLDSLSPLETRELMMIRPQLFAKVWHAAMIASVDLVMEATKDQAKKDD